jgi:hypothetical protein
VVVSDYDLRLGGNMRRVLVFATLLLMTLVGNPIAGAAAGQPPLFPTEQVAQQHCPTDTVVWLNIPSGIYHFKGQRWYGRTNSGAYVCKQEADKAGDRGSLNGQ